MDTQTQQSSNGPDPKDLVEVKPGPVVAVVAGGETASSAVAAQARAAVQARYQLALARPRDWDAVRVAILKDCKRPGFAEVARYRKPVGKDADGRQKTVDGWSIRFAEAVMRHMGNLFPETMAIYDDEEKRILRVSITELEANLTYSKDVTIAKTVERANLRDGQVPISKRTNSRGATTYLVAATEDDLLNKQNALESKAMRNHALRLLPGDIQDEAEEEVKKTLLNRAAADPDAERKKIADAFATLNVPVADLKTYLGHDLAGSSPAELVDLRKVYTSIKDGEANWREILEAKTGKPGGEEAKKQTQEIADKLRTGKKTTERQPGEEG